MAQVWLLHNIRLQDLRQKEKIINHQLLMSEESFCKLNEGQFRRGF